MKVVFFLSSRQKRQDDLRLLTVKLHIPQPNCSAVVLTITLERNIPPQWQQRVRVEEEWVMPHFLKGHCFSWEKNIAKQATVINDFWEVLANGNESAAACLNTELVISEGCPTVGSGQKLCNGFVKRPIPGFIIVMKKIGYSRIGSSRSFLLLSLFALFDRLECWGDIYTRMELKIWIGKVLQCNILVHR